ncbi:hypothetical protein EXU48_05970 [Occultella glacieicola]|uniref:Uncharacterized protein n=1 Tax=Occultella glacieicola TaxID=2518684 RepID=A0ABY2E7K1_9MICO|nr:hypothetical protein [Occultella glacieicola]TDE95806.1 hypothetical protein EXU48_05970 [Occultella glacieicola]
MTEMTQYTGFQTQAFWPSRVEANRADAVARGPRNTLAVRFGRALVRLGTGRRGQAQRRLHLDAAEERIGTLAALRASGIPPL